MISDLRFRISDFTVVRRFLLVAVVRDAVGSAQASPIAASRPPSGPAPSLKMPAIQKQKLSNGLDVWIVEHHEVPLAQINVIVRSGSAADPIGKYGVGSLAAAMLDEGAGTRNLARARRRARIPRRQPVDDQLVRLFGDQDVGAGVEARRGVAVDGRRHAAADVPGQRSRSPAQGAADRRCCRRATIRRR